MNNDFLFWNDFKSYHRGIYMAFLGLFLLSITAYSISYFIGPASVIDWNGIPIISSIPFQFDTVKMPLYELPVQLDAFFFYERLEGAPLLVNKGAGYLYLGLFILVSAILMAVITYVQGYFFYGGLSAIGFFWALMKLDLFEFAGTTGQELFVGTAVVYLAVTFCIREWFQKLGLGARYSIFLLLNVIFVSVLIVFSTAADPAFMFATLSLLPMFAITLIFIVVVAFDVLYFFLVLVTYSTSKAASGRLTQFIAITSVYLINLWIVYFDNSNTLRLGVISVSPFLLFVFSGLLGIWAVRRRSGLFNNVLKFFPFGGIWYLGLGTMAFGTITYLFYTANDPLIEVAEDAILYSQIGIGMMFLFYVIINFRQVIKQNLQAYKVVYEPRNFPFIAVRFAGIVIMGIFVFRANYFPFYQAIAGFWNARGDLYLVEGDYFLAEQYFKEGFVFENRNHKSTYSLASLAHQVDKPESELYFYKRSVEKQPTEYAYANLSNAYLGVDEYFEALFTLREGIGKFPNSAPLLNNIGLLYEKADILDSAFLFYALANSKEKVTKAARTNQLAFILKHNFIEQSGELEDYKEDYPAPLQNNLILAHSLKGKKTGVWDIPGDTILNIETFAKNYSMALAHLQSIQPSEAEHLQVLSMHPENARYREDLTMIYALSKIYNGDMISGFQIVNDLLLSEPVSAEAYRKVIGMVSFKHGLYPMAANYLNAANKKSVDGEGRFYELLAKAESGSLIDTLEWHPFTASESSAIAALAEDVIVAAYTPDPENLNKSRKLMYIMFNMPSKDPMFERKIYSSMTPDSFRHSASVVLARRSIREGHYEEAKGFLYDGFSGSTLDEQQKKEIDLLRLETLVESMDRDNVENLLIDYQSDNKSVFDFYKAWLLEGTDPIKTAIIYSASVAAFPWYEPGCDLAYKFLQSSKLKEDAYHLAHDLNMFNPLSVNNQWRYIDASLEYGMFNYAEIGMGRLSELCSGAEYSRFQTIYMDKKSLVEKRLQEW